jgi:hypothetical protein
MTHSLSILLHIRKAQLKGPVAPENEDKEQAADGGRRAPRSKRDLNVSSIGQIHFDKVLGMSADVVVYIIF